MSVRGHDVISWVHRRTRRTPEEKLTLVKQTFEPARIAGIEVTRLFQCKKAYSDSSLIAVGVNELDVSAFKMVEVVKRIRQFEAALDRIALKTETPASLQETLSALNRLRRTGALNATECLSAS